MKTQIFMFSYVSDDGEPVVIAEVFKYTEEQMRTAMQAVGDTPEDKIEMAKWMCRLYDEMEAAGAERLDITQKTFHQFGGTEPQPDAGRSPFWGG
jgi:hypothetical protein